MTLRSPSDKGEDGNPVPTSAGSYGKVGILWTGAPLSVTPLISPCLPVKFFFAQAFSATLLEERPYFSGHCMDRCPACLASSCVIRVRLNERIDPVVKSDFPYICLTR